MPIGISFIIILGLLFIIKNDSIKFLIIKNKFKEARKAVKEVYKHAKTEK